VVDEVFDRVSDFTDRFFSEGMRELSTAFSKLAQATFDGAMRGGSDRDRLAAMTRVLEDALASMKKAATQTTGGKS
jgi:hypothetical protein